MPFQSKAQQRFLFAVHPDIAHRWAREYGVPKNLPQHKETNVALNARQRRASATVAPSAGYPSGRFPMPDLKHARLALQMLPRAKNLSDSQRAAIRARANSKLSGRRAAEARAAGR